MILHSILTTFLANIKWEFCVLNLAEYSMNKDALEIKPLILSCEEVFSEYPSFFIYFYSQEYAFMLFRNDGFA